MTQIVQEPSVTTSDRARPNAQKPVGDVDRLAVFLHALAFVLGFGVVFTLIGSAVGLLGYSLHPYMRLIQQIGALLLVIFALVTLGVFRWLVTRITTSVELRKNPAAVALVSFLEFFNRLLYTEKRIAEMHQVNRHWGYLSSALLGVSFSAGWVPCIGPILAGIFLLAHNSGTAAQGAGLLAIYSLGLGIPFLITGAAFTSMSTFLRRLNRHANVVSTVSGFFLLYVAYLLWSDTLVLLTTRLVFLNEWIFQLEGWVSSSSGAGDSLASLSFYAAAPLALIAGVISFISPCVLPLVPAYIGYLSGAVVGGNRS